MTKTLRSLRCLLGLALVCGAGNSVHGEPALTRDFQVYMFQNHYVAVALTPSNQAVNEQTVEAKINGQNVTLLVDTGFERTSLTEPCARRLGLEVQATPGMTWGVGGKVQGTMGAAELKSFTLGNFEINRSATIIILPKSALTVARVDGFLGLDDLRLNAAILPINGRGFLFKPGPAAALSITDYMTKRGYKPIPLLDGGHPGLTVDCQLNGHLFRLVADSGAAYSTFDSIAVRTTLGHDLISNPIQMRGVDGRIPEIYRFKPATIKIGGFSFSPTVLIATATPTFAREGIDGLLGADFMGMHHGILDLGDNILWMK